MRFRICFSVALGVLVLGWGSTAAQLRTFSLPGDQFSWSSAQQDSRERTLSPGRFLQTVDFQRFADGIGPLEPRKVVSVPDLSEAAVAGMAPAALDSLLFDFSRNVTRYDVTAQRQAIDSGGRTVAAGEVLIPRWQSFPRGLEQVRLLRQAGVDTIVAMINVAEAYPRPPSGDKFNKGLNLTQVAIWERAMTEAAIQRHLQAMFDGNPFSHFERIDRTGQEVVKKWRLFIDLARYFPLRLIRFYPSPERPLRLSAYTLYTGTPGTERAIAGLNLDDPNVGPVGFPRFARVADTFPNFVALQSVPVNTRDTVAVILDPPRNLRYTRLDFQSDLDYDIAEIELYADGFLPEVTYVTLPLPLPAATLGRVFWDEEKIGSPIRSGARVRVQTGFNDQPLVLFRVNEFERQVEWKKTAMIIDRRPDAPTFGQQLDLNDPVYNLDAREIFSALRPDERQAVRLTRNEYVNLTGAERGMVEADLEFWSGFQGVQSGELLKAPSGRPFIQFEVTLSSESSEAATFIRNLRFEYSAPQITDEIKGEIAPAVDVFAGQDTTFVLACRAVMSPGSNGFNRLQVFTPTRVGQLEKVSLVRPGGEVEELTRVDLEELPLLPGEGQFKELYIDDDQFVVGFPTIGPTPGATQPDSVLVRIQFTGRVINFRTAFTASAFLDTLAGELPREFTADGLLAYGLDGELLAYFLPQPVEEGNIIDFERTEGLTDRNSLSVVADITKQSKNLVSYFLATPNPFTPNGDGINDELSIFYDLQRLLVPRPVSVEIYDLGGQRVKSVTRNLRSGGYSETWDGKDENGQLVPPGLYLLRISAEADEAIGTQMQLISVVY